MTWKKLTKALLYPPFAVALLLLPFSTVLLVGSMVFLGTESPVAIASYVLSAYTLTVWCMKTPRVMRAFKAFKSENRLMRRWREDTRFRVNLSLYVSLVWNILYGVFQLWLGFYHRTFWFFSLGAYYICLAVMRFFLIGHTRKHLPGERIRKELSTYRFCGWIFLLMNLALALIVFFMLYWNRSFEHHMITAIAMAAYTFTTFTVAIVNVVTYKKYKSPAFSASKAISFAAACVSMLTLTSTLLTTFSDGTMGVGEQKLLLGLVGFTVSAVVVVMALYMIVSGTKQLKRLNTEVQNGKS